MIYPSGYEMPPLVGINAGFPDFISYHQIRPPSILERKVIPKATTEHQQMCRFK